MAPRQLIPLVVLCGTVALVGWGAAWLGVFGSSGIENSAIGDGGATRSATPLSADAEGLIEAPLASAMGSEAAVATSHRELPEPTVAPAAVSVGKAATADPDSPETASVFACLSAAEVSVLEAPSRDSRPTSSPRVGPCI